MATIKEIQTCLRITVVCDCGCELELHGADDYETCACGRIYSTSEEGNGIKILADELSSNIAKQCELVLELIGREE